jgi:hypothetical protein
MLTPIISITGTDQQLAIIKGTPSYKQSSLLHKGLY